MYELKKIGKIFTSKFVGTGHSSYKKRIYWAAVSQRLRNTALNEAANLDKERHNKFQTVQFVGSPPHRKHTQKPLVLQLQNWRAHMFSWIQVFKSGLQIILGRIQLTAFHRAQTKHKLSIRIIRFINRSWIVGRVCGSIEGQSSLRSETIVGGLKKSIGPCASWKQMRAIAATEASDGSNENGKKHNRA